MDMLLAALLVACALASSGTAQPTPPGKSYDYTAGAGSQQPPQQDMAVSTTMIALLAGAVAVFVFIALSIIYLRHCTGYYDNAYTADRSTLPGAMDGSTFISRRHRQHRGTASTRGLDKEVVEAFPTMKYAEAKALRVGKTQALECAVCLSEFEDEEKLRLLPRCSHAFHPDCIGAWLASHVTCPVCRRNLDPSKDPGSDDEPGSILPSAPAAAAESNHSDHSHSISSEIAAVVVVGLRNDGDVAIDVAAELEDEERRKEALELQRIGTQQRRAMRSRSSNKKARLVRSHSTGHDSLAAASAAAGRDDMERFTLRLPEHVRREMMATASSWDQPSSTRRGQKSGGGVSASSRRGATKWPSFFACTTRTWSGRLPVFLPISRRAPEQSYDGGEVSSTSSSRIRGKRVAAVDVVDGGGFAVGAADRFGGGEVGSVAVDVDYKATSRQVRT